MKIYIPFKKPLNLGNNWKMYLSGNYGIFLNSDIPFWFVFNNKFISIFNSLINDVPLSSLLHKINKPEMDDFLWQYGLFKAALHNSQDSISLKYMPSIHYYATNKCNLNCIHCYKDASSNNNMEEIPLEYVGNYIKSLKKLNSNIKYCNISGGEPLLRYNILKFCRKLREAGYYINLITNGTLLHKFDINEVVDSIHEVQLSIDGATPDMHNYIRKGDSFNSIVNTIHRLNLYDNLRINISICIMPENYSNIKNNLRDFLKKIPANVNLRFGRIKSFGRASKKCFNNEQMKYLDNFIDIAVERGWWRGSLKPPEKYIGCGYGDTIVIESNGDVFPCAFPFNQYGNILINDPVSILSYSNNIYDKNLIDKFENCRYCDFRYICGGQCRLDNLDQYDDINPKCNKADKRNIIINSIIRGYIEQRKILKE
jgi:radical SAM protein with 4Fe4S-binding SPASM domain